MSKKFDWAFSLVVDFDQDRPYYLFAKTHFGRHELPWSERAEGQTYRQCVSSNLAARFDLDPKRDFIVCSTPRISLIVDPSASQIISREQATEEGFGILEVYPVQMFGKSGRQKLTNHASAVWMNSATIDRAGQLGTVTDVSQLLIDTLELNRAISETQG